MTIRDAILEYRKNSGVSQQDFANNIHVDRSLVSKVENGKETFAEHHDPAIAKQNWKLALSVIDERSGGYISNILDDVPNLDLHPAALKEIMLKELDEAVKALGELLLARHIDPEKRKAQAEKVWHEITDVIEKALIMKGVLEEEFDLNRDRLNKVHEMELKKGER